MISIWLGRETFSALQLVGFLLVVAGTLVYNEIIVLPIPWFSDWTKIKIAERDGPEKGILDDDNTVVGDIKKTAAFENKDYMSSSPHAVYDSTRNMRILAHQ